MNNNNTDRFEAKQNPFEKRESSSASNFFLMDETIATQPIRGVAEPRRDRKSVV